MLITKTQTGKTVRDKDGEPILVHEYSVETGTVLTINTKTKKLYNGDKELKDISAALTPQKVEFIRAGGSYAVVFGKKSVIGKIIPDFLQKDLLTKYMVSQIILMLLF